MRALLLAVGLALSPACLVDIDYEGTEFRCQEEPTCPPGHACVGGVCVLDDGGAADASPVDAGTADADPADADLPDAE